MKIKKLFTAFLSMSFALSCFNTTAFANEEQPAFEVTDDHVVIDSVAYELVNNTIQYDGMTFELRGYSLYSIDTDGSLVVMILPVEQNQVTDPEKIAQLNAGLKATKDVPSNPESLPYTADVKKGTSSVTTPYFEINPSKYYYYTMLSITDVSPKTTKFSAYFSCCDMLGKWYSDEEHMDWDFSKPLKVLNMSTTRYGGFIIESPSSKPSYTYKIYLSNKYI